MRMGRLTRCALAALSLAVAAGVAACSGTAHTATSPSSGNAKTIKVAFGSTYVFDTTGLTNKWWNQVAQQFEASHPGIKVQLVPIPGSYNDIVNKLSLLYRNPSTAPDVAEIPTGQIGLWASSGYLRPLNSELPSTSCWNEFPVVQREGTFGGKVSAVNQSENDSAIFYNKKLFAQAGISVPWTPHNWSDILAAARKIKAKLPGVIPLWFLAGSGSGANGLLQGINNFIVGTATPKIQDGNKWVVDSPGIRDSLTLLKTVVDEGLDASESQLFSPNAVTTPLALFPQGKLAIAIGSNYYPGNWTKFINAPAWPAAPQTMGVVPIPTEHGGGIASTLGGWDYAISANSGNPKAAFDLINIMENRQNSIDAANWAGWVPPNKTYWTAPAFTNFAFSQALFGQILPHATLTPSSANYSIWVQGMGNATGQIVQNPNTTVNQAINTLKSYVSNQLGPDSVETLK